MQTLQNQGVIVLFRPFHEMNGGWFWWGAHSPQTPSAADFVTLWRFVHDYFTNAKGLKNLIWVYSPGNSELTMQNYSWGIVQPTTYYYPGDKYVDVIGIDYYKDRLTAPPHDPNAMGSSFSIPTYARLAALGKPMGLAEFGPGNPEKQDFDFDSMVHELARDYPKFVFFIAWQDDPAHHKYFSIINNPNAAKLMNDPLVLTRDDIQH